MIRKLPIHGDECVYINMNWKDMIVHQERRVPKKEEDDDGPFLSHSKSLIEVIIYIEEEEKPLYYNYRL